MVIDDDALMLQTISELLQPWGLAVTTLQDPAQFWDVLTATLPDLLLLDLQMPTFNGIDLCRVVRQDSKWGDLPILVITAYTDSASIQQVFAAGADDFIALAEDRDRFVKLDIAGVITKPFEPLYICNQIAALLDWNE